MIKEFLSDMLVEEQENKGKSNLKIEIFRMKMLTNNPINHSVLKLSKDFDNAFKHKNIVEIYRLIEFGKNMENTIDD